MLNKNLDFLIKSETLTKNIFSAVSQYNCDVPDKKLKWSQFARTCPAVTMTRLKH